MSLLACLPCCGTAAKEKEAAKAQKDIADAQRALAAKAEAQAAVAKKVAEAKAKAVQKEKDEAARELAKELGHRPSTASITSATSMASTATTGGGKRAAVKEALGFGFSLPMHLGKKLGSKVLGASGATSRSTAEGLKYYVLQHRGPGQVEGWVFPDIGKAEAQYKTLQKRSASAIYDSTFKEIKFWGMRRSIVLDEFKEWWEGAVNNEDVQQLDDFLAEFILPTEDASDYRNGRVISFNNPNLVKDNDTNPDAVVMKAKSKLPTLDEEGEHQGTRSRGSTQATSSRSARLNSDLDLDSIDCWWGTGPDKRLEVAMPGHTLLTEVCDAMVKKAGSLQSLRNEILPSMKSQGLPKGKYVMWQLKFGKLCFVSVHEVINGEQYEKLLKPGSAPLLNDALKLIVTPVNLVINVPVKGPKDADTIGTFFGSNVTFERATKDGYDISMLGVDLYSVWSLRMLLPSVAFKPGRMVDFHLVSYRDNAVFASYRASMTNNVIEQISSLG